MGPSVDMAYRSHKYRSGVPTVAPIPLAHLPIMGRKTTALLCRDMRRAAVSFLCLRGSLNGRRRTAFSRLVVQIAATRLHLHLAGSLPKWTCRPFSCASRWSKRRRATSIFSQQAKHAGLLAALPLEQQRAEVRQLELQGKPIPVSLIGFIDAVRRPQDRL